MAYLTRWTLAVVLASAGLLACGDDDDGGSGAGGADANVSQDRQSATLGSDGGELAIEGARLEVPEGALSADKELSVERLSAAAAQRYLNRLDDGSQAVSDVLVLTPHGSQFDAPVSVTLAYRGADDGLVVKRLDDEDDATWDDVAAVRLAGGEASFETMRFSLIVVAREDVQAASDGGATGLDAGLPTDPPAMMDAGKPQEPGSTVDGDFEITVDDSFEVAQGNTARLNVVAMRAAGFDDPIDITVEGLPEGVSAQDAVISGPDNGTLVELTADQSAAAGTTEITVRATAGATEREASVALTVVGPPKSFMIGVLPYAFSIARGGSTEVTLTLTPVNGFEGTVELSFGAGTEIEGVSVEPTSVECEGTEPTTQTLTFSASGDAPVGAQNTNLEAKAEQAEASTAIGLGITIE